MAGEQPDDIAAQAVDPTQSGTAKQPPKRILLFSDGTGNSSAKLFKTNVWRMYEATDLGPPPQGSTHTQIAFYDNGVGTSSFKLFAVLGGIFGLGLKRNILTIYRYLCRNYRPGDEIYCFGFSRGAYTIRLVAGLIGAQGIVRGEDEADLLRQTADAYRAFCRLNDPNVFPYLARLGRVLRDVVLRIWRWRHKPYRPATGDYATPPIAFMGVWDTVAAYGGPIAEITRGIDDWVWPLTMTDQELGPHVQCARHALALDDERDSFWPVLWDEVYESRKAKAAADALERAETIDDRMRLEASRFRYTYRIKQVWFAGMHADVGGGYPDESLSYVSLRWMMAEACMRGLRLLPELVRRVDELATEYGPLHNSREGLSLYYRYQPRKIAAFLHPDGEGSSKRLFAQTASLRDPRVGDRLTRPQGLLLSCHVHESVIGRIQSGTDGYVPLALPEKFDITYPPDKPIGAIAARPQLLSPETRANIAATAAQRWQRQEVLWNRVWVRRGLYFATLIVTFLIVLMPVVNFPNNLDGRSVVSTLVDWLGYLLPGFAKPWTNAIAAGPIYFLILFAAVVILNLASTGQERALRDGMRRMWRESLAGAPQTGATDSFWLRFRTSRPYQYALQFLKWRLLPNLLGPLMLLAIGYAFAIFCAQMSLSFKEPAGSSALCRRVTMETLREPATFTGPLVFRTRRVCKPTQMVVHAGHRYRITLQMTEAWRDGPAMRSFDPRGQTAWVRQAESPLLTRAWVWSKGWIFAPFRRMVSAPWLATLYEVRPQSGSVHIDRLDFHPPTRSEPNSFSAEITPASDGALMLFANDVVLPFLDERTFYSKLKQGRNQGRALVSVVDLDASTDDRTAASANESSEAH